MITKKDILRKYKAASFSSIKDEDLISLAENGELGIQTMYSVAKKWAFSNTHTLAEKIREAVNKGKEIRVVVIEGENYEEDKIVIELV